MGQSKRPTIYTDLTYFVFPFTLGPKYGFSPPIHFWDALFSYTSFFHNTKFVNELRFVVNGSLPHAIRFLLSTYHSYHFADSEWNCILWHHIYNKLRASSKDSKSLSLISSTWVCSLLVFSMLGIVPHAVVFLQILGARSQACKSNKY